MLHIFAAPTIARKHSILLLAKQFGARRRGVCAALLQTTPASVAGSQYLSARCSLYVRQRERDKAHSERVAPKKQENYASGDFLWLGT
jgi:hypothetical protein